LPALFTVRCAPTAKSLFSIRHVTVSVELQEPVGIEPAQTALAEIRATQDEFSEFFGDVFDELQTLSLELFARHKCLEVGAGQKAAVENSVIGCREEFLRAIDQLQQLHGQFQADREESQQSWTEIRLGYQKFADDHAELRELRESLQQLLAEFSGTKNDVEQQRKRLQELCANVEDRLARLTSLAAELAEARTQPANDPQIAAILENARQQQADWVEQRTALQAELESMRRRAAEQTEALNEQKLIAAQQQAELVGELKRMRSLLDALSSQVRGEPASLLNDKSVGPVDSSVLGTVLAQFEMLQRDITVRRSQRNHGPGSAKT
jgi:DNA repair exonuclease SbcCD ATPase subunit